ncbi:MAG: Gfo/Idh/MocA family oxidoreductase [Candidatus Melainabacteria bacterium]|nr:MAG: Gfo/Idh/MocA family oxidoreductase [Candidatus Melainabacteria bacterium]
MKCLVIGYGSIGARHAEILKAMGHQVQVYSERNVSFPSVVQTVEEGLSDAEYVVIATETHRHLEGLRMLQFSGYKGIVLVEKPLFSTLEDSDVKFDFKLYVGYNLRFHPAVMKLKSLIAVEQVLSVHCYVGQHLASWRQDRETNSVYSSWKDRGGGVLLDLSHEIDLLQYLFGKTMSVKAMGGRVSDLTVDSADVFGVLLKSEKCSVTTLQLNYLDNLSQRQLIVNTKNNTYLLDLVKNSLISRETVEQFDTTRNTTYIEQHRRILHGVGEDVCTYHEGINVLRTVEEVEKSAND